jgi:hypothetical protein
MNAGTIPEPLAAAAGDDAGGRRRWPMPRVAALAAALAAAALLTAACGGGSSSAGSSGAGQRRLAQALAFAHCMRSHGAPNYPDPNSSGAFMVNPSTSSRYEAPLSTREACAHLLPRKGQPPSQALTEQQQRESLALVACMHRHGFPNFPGDWSQWRSGNIGMLISAGIDPKSPRLNAAFTQCGPR